MRLLKHKTHINFIGRAREALFVSTTLNLLVLAGLGIFGLNLGVDFVGGTLVELKFEEAIDASALRTAAIKGGLHDPQVQGLGAADEHSFLVRVGGTTQLTDATAQAASIALRGVASVSQVMSPDLESGLMGFRATGPLDLAQVKATVEKAAALQIKEVRSVGAAPGGGFDYQLVAQGMAPKIEAALHASLEGRKFEVRRIDYVGPQVGKQLRNKGIAAVFFASLALMLYVAFRFDLTFAPGVIVGLVHDVVMVLGYYVLTRREFNLTAVAALLTALGYSVNDRIVVYDRIREEMGRFRGKNMTEIINIAINSTLARTILTSGVTAMSLVGLLVFGVGEIFDFAAAMLVGILVGTYSSIYIASPLTIWMAERAKRRPAKPLPS